MLTICKSINSQLKQLFCFALFIYLFYRMRKVQILTVHHFSLRIYIKKSSQVHYFPKVTTDKKPLYLTCQSCILSLICTFSVATAMKTAQSVIFYFLKLIVFPHQSSGWFSSQSWEEGMWNNTILHSPPFPRKPDLTANQEAYIAIDPSRNASCSPAISVFVARGIWRATASFSQFRDPVKNSERRRIREICGTLSKGFWALPVTHKCLSFFSLSQRQL